VKTTALLTLHVIMRFIGLVFACGNCESVYFITRTRATKQ